MAPTVDSCRRIAVDRHGYARNGAWWGRRLPVYRFTTIEGQRGHVRARTRDRAKPLVRALLGGAAYFRR